MSKVNYFFYKGNSDTLSDIKDEKTSLNKIQESFNKILDGKNLSFLLGSGCSSFMVEEITDDILDGEIKEWVEVGISTMLPLAKSFFDKVLSEEEKEWLKTQLFLDVTDDKFYKNIEFFLGVLHSYKFYLESVSQDDVKEVLEGTEDIIEKTKNFILEKVLNETNRIKDEPLRNLYERFYRKLLYRNLNLPKVNIFTTNYDLYSENALDRLGIHYVNGFSGGINKYFNPTIFNYALSEKMDLSQSKWNIIDNFVYLYKIHGSVNWIADETESKLFKIREIQEATFDVLSSKENIMIHPTPLKQNASLGSPYSDLFREFQKKLMQNNNILVTLGYSFSDEHINNLIYQAFTIPSFRLIIVADHEASKEIKLLKNLNDPRIWIIGGVNDKGEQLHYFKGFVDEILSDLSNDEINDKIEEAVKNLFKRNQ